MEHKYHLCVRHTDEPSSVASAKGRTYSPASCSDLTLILRSDTVPPPPGRSVMTVTTEDKGASGI